MITLIKKWFRQNEIKMFWKNEVNQIFSFFNQIRIYIKPEDLTKAESLVFEDMHNVDELTVNELSRICNTDLSSIGVKANQEQCIDLVSYYDKFNNIFLGIKIIDETWTPNYNIFKITEIPKFISKSYRIYEDGDYYLNGLSSLKIPNSNFPISIIFPLTKKNKSVLIQKLYKERLGDRMYECE